MLYIIPNSNCRQPKKIVVAGQTGKARRIPLNESLYELFSYLFLKRKGRKFVFENPKTKKPIVCIKRSFKTLLKKKGILNVRFHDLRHTFSTYSLLNGCDIFHLSQILGHTNLTTTMRYLSVKTEGLQKVVNSFVVKDPKSSPRSLYVLKTGSQK